MAAENKRDIMDALLKGVPTEATPEAPLLARLLERPGKKPPLPGHSSESPPCPPPKKAHPGKCKKKSTHYLSEKIFADLDEARAKITELVHPRLKSRISKSRIVDQALRMILKDFGEKGEKSHLLKEILKDLRKK